jgi:redox-sensitive bicupin YhaK (pirin superfamily)
MSTATSSVRKIEQGSLHLSKPTWWLESRFHFSFAGWYDPKKSNFGALRVLNDDLVKPRAGFGAHPHRDAEIFSYIVEGELSHEDSMGNREALPRGCVQYLSAGQGIYHSEMNAGQETCRFLQVWLTPDKRGHTPQYGSSTYSKEDRHNKLLHLLGGTGTVPEWKTIQQGHGIQLHQDANVFVSESDSGVSHSVDLGPSRQAYLVCIEGQMTVDDGSSSTHLTMRDAAAVVNPSPDPLPLVLKAGESGAHFLLIEMQKA